MRFFTKFQTKFGEIALVEDGAALTNLCFFGEKIPDACEERTPLLVEACAQLSAYLSGGLRQFTVPLSPDGTVFQKAVWQALLAIPYGQTLSYGQIARQLGNPNACRAVGMANHCNPIPILIPCHRVIGSNGRLTGYRGGLEWKQALLALEEGKSE